MEFFKKSIFLVLIILGFNYCGSKHQRQMEFKQEISRTYYKTQVDNQQQAVSINFYIEFKEPLSKEVSLEKIYFRNKEAEIEKVSDIKYVAHFLQTAMLRDFILDSDSKKEYGNRAPIIVKPKFELNNDEAVLEYQKNNKILFLKLTGINEKQ
jgi:hypothetical protein